MASNDIDMDFNDLFKQQYGDILEQAYDVYIQKKYAQNGKFTKMSMEGLERYKDKYEGAKKELNKRNSPLWKTLNE
jgi:hypothetical protein